MWIQCPCGNQIKDITDGIAYKAHYISDQDWFEVLDRIDSAIKDSGTDRERLSRELYSFLCHKTKDMYQCTECGRLFVDDNKRELSEFAPAPSANGEIFRSK